MDKQYIILNSNKEPAHPFKNGGKPWDEVKDFDNIAMIVPEPFIVLDFDTASDARIMLSIVNALDLHCKVMRTERGYHFWFKSSEHLKNFVKGRLAIGIYCDRKVCKRNAYVKIKGNGKLREWLRDYEDNDVDFLPKWLTEVSAPNNMFNFKGMGNGDGRNQQLFNYILFLQDNGFKKADVIRTLEIINKYVFDEALSEYELRGICRDEAFKSDEELEAKDEPNDSDGFKFHHEDFALNLMERFDIISVNGLLYIYKDGYYRANGNEIEKAMIEMYPAIKRFQRAEVLDYLRIIADKTSVIANLERNPYIINIDNGRLNLLTGELLPYDAEAYDFCRIPIKYNPSAVCKILDDTLGKIFCHNTEVLNLVYEVIGNCLLSEEIYQKAFIFYGSGANGKSTFFYLLKRFLGAGNVSSIELDKLGTRFQTAELEHKLANIGDDLNYTSIKNNGTVKKLISGDSVQIERKNEKPYSFTSYATQIFATNDLPYSNDKSDGMMRRLCLIPCLAKFGLNGEARNPLIKYDITTEDALSHLLNLAIEGLKRLKDNGDFTEPTLVQEAKAMYIVENSSVLSWIEEEGISKEFILENQTKNLYSFFCLWCKESNVKDITGKKTFNKEIIKKFKLSPSQIKKRLDDGRYGRFFKEEAY